MDILALLSTFTDTNASRKSLQLFLDAADSLQCFSSENSEAIKHTLQYLKSNLSKSKSCSIDPLMMLHSVVQQCAPNIFAENCMQWIDYLQKIIRFNANDAVIRLACDISSEIVFYLSQNADLSREFSSVYLGNLVTSLVINNTKIQIHLLKCLRQCMIQFRGSCRQLQTEIEQFLLSLFISEDMNVLKEVAACYVLLPSLGGGGDQGSYHSKAWEELCQKILGSLYSIVSKILKRVQLDESIWNLKESLTLNLPTVDETLPTLLLQKSYKSYCSLCFCLMEILSSSFPFPVHVPVGEIMGFICTVLSLPTSDLLSSHRTTEDLMLIVILPSLQTTALDVLQVLIENCNRYLIQYSEIIVDLLLQLLNSTKAQKNWAGTKKPYSELRRRVYKIIRIWATSSSSASGFEKQVENFFLHIISDIQNDTSYSTMTKASISEPRAKRRKMQTSHSGVEKLGHSKNNPVLNSELNKAALEAFRYMMLAVGPTLNHSVYMNASTTLIQSIQNVQCRFLHAASPYKDPECRQQLYAALLSIITMPSNESMPPMHTSLNLFRKGLQDDDHMVKGFCLEALNTCANLLHPRVDRVQTYNTSVVPPSNHMEMELDDSGKVSTSTESKLSQTSNVDSFDVACSPIPQIPEESVNHKIFQCLETDQPAASISKMDERQLSINNVPFDLSDSTTLGSKIHVNESSSETDDSETDMNEAHDQVPGLCSQSIIPCGQPIEEQEKKSEEISDILKSFVNSDPDHS